MLIDINAYIGHWPFRPLQGSTLAATLERMNAYGVDKTVVANVNGIFYKDPQFSNAELHEAIGADEAFEERFIPFAVINPVLPWAGRALETCHEDYGMRGIRLYPVYHRYELSDQRCIDLVGAARDRGMAVAIPQRMVDPRQRSWMDVEETVGLGAITELVSSVPDAKYIVLDTRSARPPGEEALQVLQEADILFDTTRTSGVPITGFSTEDLNYLVETYGPEKIAFGTGTPFLDYCSPFIRIEVFEEGSDETKELIWSGNARRMLDV